MTSDAPILFVTGHAPPDRAGAFAALHEREGIELALFGGRLRHAVAEAGAPPAPHRRVAQREVYELAASGSYRAVVCGTGGRVALPAAYLGARRARVPFVLWASLWAHPRTPAHLLSALPLRRIYRRADAVVTYGPHVSEYVRARGARNVHDAPQAVDNAFWSAPVTPDPAGSSGFTAMFAGRFDREKGIAVLLGAWRASGLAVAPNTALVLAGDRPGPARLAAGGAVSAVGPLAAAELRNFYARADVVVLPSIRTRAFLEPWGLVANEAMNQGTAIIASDAVGAVAGGLVRHERNGLVVPAGDEAALAAALRRLHDDPALTARLGAQGREDVGAYTHERWAAGFSAALASVAASTEAC